MASPSPRLPLLALAFAYCSLSPPAGNLPLLALASPPPDQKFAIREFYTSIYGHADIDDIQDECLPPWGGHQGWLVCSGPSRDVVKIDMDGHTGQLRGSLPSHTSLRYLTALTYLKVAEAKKLDPKLIPSELGLLTNLRKLYLNGCGFAGSLPSEVGRLNKLDHLSLNDNALTHLPSQLGYLTRLTYLWVNSNRIGVAPREVGRMASLESLNMGVNQELYGTIPTEFGRLSQLTYLSFNVAKLSGTIPSELGRLSKLSSLYISRNLLGGPIPTTLGLLANLRHLDLSTNPGFGHTTFPTELGQLASLQSLNLKQLDACGTIPTEWASGMLGLITFDFSYNELEGEVPVFQSTKLTEVGLSCQENSKLHAGGDTRCSGLPDTPTPTPPSPPQPQEDPLGTPLPGYFLRIPGSPHPRQVCGTRAFSCEREFCWCK